jgi:hypothetical protein
MLVATETFTTTYDGRTVDIEAGRDRITSDHPIVTSHPHAFAGAIPRGRQSRTARRAER